ncbi:pentatricopeptide repeat-containing protein At5g66520-like [Actinidia eriantha]|uniref:pentatricopeptide repeat-containing protein At5g66520-like n=1 Tax=Actinidia eriantha TaxID=165200 RepID=UPI002582D442|nr:pentatricopeptide repeat-containing protein At5g66520-like [Actinidia eriantha]
MRSLNGIKAMRLFLLLKPTIQQQTILFLRTFNSWSFAIRNASSPHKALQLYSQMQRLSVPFDSFSILFTLSSCTHLHNLSLIRHVHAHLLKLGFNSHVYVATSLLHAYVVASLGDACNLFDEMPERNTVTWNTMIAGYSKAGQVEMALQVFDRMPLRDIASWSAMIAGYMSNGRWGSGLMLFREMIVLEELKPDQVTLGSILAGCAHMGSIGLLLGKSIHGFIVKNGWVLNVELGTVLVDMYAKLGFLKNASVVFNRMQERNVKTWTALICGSAQHGYGKEALCIFEMMKEAGVKPNELTFTGVLSACAQAGLVVEGRRYFRMIEEYGFKPTIQHYGCVVDMFGKAGLLEEAHEVVKTMRFEPNVIVWSSFLSSCKIHKQFEMAERVIDLVMDMVKPENDGGVYALISDLYVLCGKLDDAERVRKLMVNQNVRKARGSSFIGSGAS